MGLDLYAGPLTRYYSGNWESSMQRLGAQIMYADGHVPWINQEEARKRIADFRTRLTTMLEPFDFDLPEWNEANESQYETVKPDHSGREALLLWVAYIHRKDLKRPQDLPSDVSADRAYVESMGEAAYYEPHLITLDSEMFVPAEAEFALRLEFPLGGTKRVASTQLLMNTLMWINENSWNSDISDSDEWFERGLPHDEVFEFRTESSSLPITKFLSFARKKVPTQRDKLQQAAQYGFACYAKMLMFSLENDVPIIADM